MKDITSYFADKCGVETSITNEFLYRDRYSSNYIIWSIQDPRCREIIREYYGLATDKFQGGEWSCFPREMIEKAIEYMGKGKTIAEAEINCITAIYEAEKAS